MFYREGLLAPRPTPKLENHPLSAVRDCLLNLFAATLLIGGRSSIRNLRTRHAVVTGTHYIKLTNFYNIFKQFFKKAIPVFAQVRSLETDNVVDRVQARFQWPFETKSLFFSLRYFCSPINIILNWQSRLAWYELDEHLSLNLALSQQKFKKLTRELFMAACSLVLLYKL